MDMLPTASQSYVALPYAHHRPIDHCELGSVSGRQQCLYRCVLSFKVCGDARRRLHPYCLQAT